MENYPKLFILFLRLDSLSKVFISFGFFRKYRYKGTKKMGDTQEKWIFSSKKDRFIYL